MIFISTPYQRRESLAAIFSSIFVSGSFVSSSDSFGTCTKNFIIFISQTNGKKTNFNLCINKRIFFTQVGKFKFANSSIFKDACFRIASGIGENEIIKALSVFSPVFKSDEVSDEYGSTSHPEAFSWISEKFLIGKILSF